MIEIKGKRVMKIIDRVELFITMFDQLKDFNKLTENLQQFYSN